MITIAACLLWAWAARVASLVAGVALGMVTVPITRLSAAVVCVVLGSEQGLSVVLGGLSVEPQSHRYDPGKRCGNGALT